MEVMAIAKKNTVTIQESPITAFLSVVRGWPASVACCPRTAQGRGNDTGNEPSYNRRLVPRSHETTRAKSAQHRYTRPGPAGTRDSTTKNPQTQLLANPRTGNGDAVDEIPDEGVDSQSRGGAAGDRPGLALAVRVHLRQGWAGV